jgi:hypothetical protein
MVLNSEVLPAPLGPITAVIEPGCTSKPTPVSAFTPPKASVTPSTCSKGRRPPPSGCVSIGFSCLVRRAGQEPTFA